MTPPKIKTEEELREERRHPPAPEVEIKKEEIIEIVKKVIELEDIEGTFEVVSSAPTHKPKKLFDYVVFYKSEATYRVYFYVSDAWKYITLT